jgi:S-layer protein (TIGR01567 family)
MDKMKFKEINLCSITLLEILFLACAVQAAAPVSPPESRFVWEPGENLTFTWTAANFDGFFYDPENGAGSEILTIRIDKMKNRTIPKDGFVYSTNVGLTNASYRPFGEYSVIGLFGEKYLAGYPEGKSNITSKSGINPGRLRNILIDDDASYSLVMGSNLSLSEGYVLEINDVNVTGDSVILSLKKDDINVDTIPMKAGTNYIYEVQGWPIIAVHIDSVFEGKEKATLIINGIFQVSQYETLVRKGDNPTGVMWVTNISDNSITMKNAAGIVELKPGQIIDIGEINAGELKFRVADSNTLRVHLYEYWFNEKSEHRAGSNNLAAWDGLNYAGFLYDIDSGNYSESLVITNLTGRRIPEGGLTYTSYMDRLTYTNYRASVPYGVTKINDKKSPVSDWSYVTFNLGGNRYIVKSNRIAGMLTAHGVTFYDRKTLGIGPFKFNGETWEIDEGYTIDGPGEFIWELGEGYTLRAMDVNFSDPRKVRLLLKKNGVELENVWLEQKDVYKYTQTEDNEMPKLITYLDNVFAGSTIDVFQLRNTWFVSDNVTQIKEGDRLGVFNVTAIEPDRIVFMNMEPIELKAGSRINLIGNLSFFVENSDELRFYPTNMIGTQMMPENVTENSGSNLSATPVMITPFVTNPGRAEKILGFEVILLITIIMAVYIAGRKMR